jgi:peptidyl-prolyl cis-trans isomerase SurA
VLDRMVNEKILLQQAEKDGIKVSDEQIDKALEALVAESGLSREAFLAKMEKDGITEKMLRDQSRTQIATQMVMSRNVVKKVVVTEEEINDYYRKNMAGFAESRAHVAILVYAPDANAEKWAADIASGKVSFADAARKVSVGPNAENGGDLGVMAVSDMAPGMAQVVSGLSKGSVSPLLTLGEAKAQVMLIDLEEAEGAADAKPDAETARRIENILRNPRVQERFQQYTTELRQKALVDIRL